MMENYRTFAIRAFAQVRKGQLRFTFKAILEILDEDPEHS